jgi:hypothetical protein
MILVTTPTGNTGSMVLQQLVEQGQKVKILAIIYFNVPNYFFKANGIAKTNISNTLIFCKTGHGLLFNMHYLNLDNYRFLSIKLCFLLK